MASRKALEIARINSLEDYYAILDVHQEATVEEITKSFKQLAPLVHPDKNTSPDATRAFQKLGGAYTVLTDPEKRRDFDTYGFGGRPSEPIYRFHFGDEDTEEVFRTFFGDRESFTYGFTEAEVQEILSQLARERFRQEEMGERQERNRRNRRGGRNRGRPTEVPQETQTQREQNVNGNTNRNVLYFLGVLIFLILGGVWLYVTPEQLYSFEKIREYRIPKTTLNLNIQYFVKNGDFLEKFQGSRKAFEDVIEQEYILKMKDSCSEEIYNRDFMMWKARSLQDRQMFKKAHYYKMAACDALSKYGVNYS